jgi:tetratricopeptide (TPR) repeat protein
MRDFYCDRKDAAQADGGFTVSLYFRCCNNIALVFRDRGYVIVNGRHNGTMLKHCWSVFACDGKDSSSSAVESIVELILVGGRTPLTVAGAKGQLKGWKEIATYFGRDERTVKRWEKMRGLPVRRIPGSPRSNVYGLVPELEAWLASAQASYGSLDAGLDEAELIDAHGKAVAVAGDSLATLPALPAAQEEFSETILTGRPQAWRGWSRVWWGAAVLGVMLAGVGGYKLLLPRPIGAKSTAAVRPVQPHGDSADPAAHQLYLQGNYFFEARSPASLEQATRLFNAAIEKDPSCAAAYVGLANSYLLLREYGTMPPDEAYEKAEVATRRAIALNPNLPQAHAALGFIEFFHLWEPSEADQEFQTALRLDPDSAIAHHWYGSMLMHQARHDQALEQLNEAQRLQPASSAIVASKALALGLGGRRDEASNLLQTAVEIDPDSGALHRSLAILSLVQPRDLARYLDERRRYAMIRKDQEELDVVAAGESGYRSAGEQGMWAAMLAIEKKLHPEPGHPTYFMAEVEAALQRNDDAVRDLEALVAQKDSKVIGIASEPLFESLRQDARFQRIEAKIGLDPH